MEAVLLGVVGASLLGSPHCAGMCGPFAILGGPSRSTRVLYHATRVAAYAGLGGLAGALGAGLDLGGAVFGLQRVALSLAAVTLLGAGAWMLLRSFGGLRLRLEPPPLLRSIVTRVARAAARRRPTTRAALLGGASAVLPCGWLYAFVTAAAGTGDPAHGALVMFAFGLGTVPVLALVTIGARRLAEPLRRRAPAAVGVALLILGGLALSGRFAVPPLKGSSPTGDVAAQVEAIDPSALPCCGDEGARDGRD